MKQHLLKRKQLEFEFESLAQDIRKRTTHAQHQLNNNIQHNECKTNDLLYFYEYIQKENNNE